MHADVTAQERVYRNPLGSETVPVMFRVLNEREVSANSLRPKRDGSFEHTPKRLWRGWKAGKAFNAIRAPSGVDEK